MPGYVSRTCAFDSWPKSANPQAANATLRDDEEGCVKVRFNYREIAKGCDYFECLKISQVSSLKKYSFSK
jgi:hypothetical protein